MKTLTVRQSTTSGLDVISIQNEFKNMGYDINTIDEKGGFTVEITLKGKPDNELYKLKTEIRQRLNQITFSPYTPPKKD